MDNKEITDTLLMDDTNKAILNRIQSDFPITSRPYQTIGNDLGIPEAEVIERLDDLKKMGIIRRIGGNFVPGKLGFVSTLCAARVPEEKIEYFAQVVNQFSGVTHNYQRDNSYNVWFTFIAPTRETITENIAMISRQTGVDQIIDLPATRVFKIRAQFDLA
ncbi:MAG: AsnC family transcriptional regulator [Desulfobacterales bacterium]